MSQTRDERCAEVLREAEALSKRLRRLMAELDEELSKQGAASTGEAPQRLRLVPPADSSID